MLNPFTGSIQRTPEMLSPDVAQAYLRPTELQTENGFAIVRLCDVDPHFSKADREHRFVARDPHGYELEIEVEILPDAVAEVIHRSRGRITLASSYWINFAERHLANYLWEYDDYPPGAMITINELSITDIDLAQRWDNDKGKLVR